MRIVAITGGAQGIGRATAYHFATAGYGVSICDPDDDAGREALDCIRSLGAKGVFAAIDVAREDDVRGWIARTGHELGCPDVLINNAGITRNKPFLDLTAEDFDTVIGVNLRGTFLCSQAVARRMVARGRGGAIINIASTRAFMSEAGTEGRDHLPDTWHGDQPWPTRDSCQRDQPRLDRDTGLAVFLAREGAGSFGTRSAAAPGRLPDFDPKPDAAELIDGRWHDWRKEVLSGQANQRAPADRV